MGDAMGGVTTPGGGGDGVGARPRGEGKRRGRDHQPGAVGPKIGHGIRGRGRMDEVLKRR